MATIPSRARFLEQALRCWNRQTYPAARRELILLTEGNVAVRADLGMGGGAVVTFPTYTRLGVKLNRGVEIARGNLLVKLDDDDWYGETYIERSLKTVLSSKDPERVILTPSVFPVYFVATGEVRLWKSEWSGLGSGMFFSRRHWVMKKWNEEIQRGLDKDFIQRAKFDATPAPDDAPFCYIRHGIGHLFRDVGPETADDYFRRVFPLYGKTLEEFMPPEDVAFYRKMTADASGGTLRG
jgi:glycosyltransferase involved in cell wall biosynthesis